MSGRAVCRLWANPVSLLETKKALGSALWNELYPKALLLYPALSQLKAME